MEETSKEAEIQGNNQTKWKDSSFTIDAKDEQSSFSRGPTTAGILQQQNPALGTQMSAVSLQGSSVLPQMPIYPSRFFYQYYTQPPYGRPLYDPCAPYPAFYQGEEYRPKEKRRRCRTVFTQEQLMMLEEGFAQHKYPDGKFRQEMANKTGLAEDRVQVWFQNRRAKEKRLMEEKMFRESQAESSTLTEPESEVLATSVHQTREFLGNSYQSQEDTNMRQLELVSTEPVRERGLGNNIEGTVTKEGNPLPDITVSSYLTPGPLPRSSLTQVGQPDREERNTSSDLLSLDQPNSTSAALLAGLPRHLFSNTNVSAFCESSVQPEDNSSFQTSSEDVFVPEPVRAQTSYCTLADDSLRLDVEVCTELSTEVAGDTFTKQQA